MSQTVLSTKKGKMTYLYAHRYFCYTLVGLIAGYVIFLQLFTIPQGHDLIFHANRIEWLTQALRAGEFPVRIYHGAMGGMGYAAPLFYGDLFLYIPAALHAVGVPLEAAYKLFVGLCAICMTVFMYWAANQIFSDRTKAFCAAIMYTLSSYIATDLLERQALGEYQSFVFLPLVMLGMYSIVNGDKKKWLLLPVGLAGVVMTHVITAVLCVSILLVYLLMHLKAVKRDKKILGYLAGSAALFFLLSAGFLLPMLEQMFSQKFYVTTGVYEINLASRALPLSKLFVWGDNDLWLPFVSAVGYLALLLALTALYLCKRKPRNRTTFVFLCLAWGTYLLATDLFPWGLGLIQKSLYFIQFPWRFLTFTTLFLAFATGDIARVAGQASVRAGGRKLLSKTLLAVVMGITVVSYSVVLLYKVSDPNPEGLSDVPTEDIGAGGEYLPANANYDALLALSQREDPVVASGSAQHSLTRRYSSLTLSFTQENDNFYFDVPLIYYKGYEAKAQLPGGEVVNLPVQLGDAGLTRVYVGDIKEGTLTVWYRGTALQSISLTVSVLAAAGTILFVLRQRRKAGRKARAREIYSA